MFSPHVEKPAVGPDVWVISPLDAMRSAHSWAVAFRALFAESGALPSAFRAMLTQVSMLSVHVAGGGGGGAASAGGSDVALGFGLGFGVADGVGVGVAVREGVGIGDADASGEATNGPLTEAGTSCGAATTTTPPASTPKTTAITAAKMLLRWIMTATP